MKRFIMALAAFGLIAAPASAQDSKTAEAKKAEPPADEIKVSTKPAAAAAPLKGKELTDKAGYAIGVDFGKRLKPLADFDLEQIFRGIRDGFAGKSELTEAATQDVMQAFRQVMNAKQEEAAKSAADKNAKEGAAFLAANKAKPGVKVTASGLQYKVLKEGTGATPKATDEVSVHYRGTLLDGTEFDSSIKRNMPAEFPVGGVIKGWIEALQLMKVGSKWQLFIPSQLAYGANGTPDRTIGPNATLVFEVELLGIK